MIPLTRKLEIEVIAGLSHGTVDDPKHDDVDLTVRFTNADDKHTFISNFHKVKPKHMRIAKSEHGLVAKVECLSYGYFTRG